MVGRFVLTPSATKDLDGIFEYVLKQDSPGRAQHVYKRVYDGFCKVAEQPGLGHTRDDLGDRSLRVWTVFSYLIVYRPETRPVQIIRVIHGARDFPAAIESD